MTRDQVAWRCRRGTRELDLMLEAYLREAYDVVDEPERRQFQQLLTLPDDLIWRWLTGAEQPVDAGYTDLVGKIRATAALRS